MEVFDRALNVLLEERDPGRFDVRAAELSSLARRRAVAAHLALIWILTGAKSFRIGTETEAEATELTMSTVPLYLPTGERINESEVRDVLASALFSARGRGRVGWADGSFSEYLAARQLALLHLPVEQLENLFFDRGRADGRLFPQLREVAGWLIAMDPTRLCGWIDADPIAVVLAAVRLPDTELRQQLVESLLRWSDEGRVMRWLRVELRHLAHPGLAGQLRPRIVDPSVSDATRSLAIDIAEACQVTDLAEDLAYIALEHDEPTPLRINAGYAVIRIADTDHRALLLPLATEGQEGDDDLELKGLALLAGWPEHLTAQQVFDLLDPSPELIGAYWRFISHTLPQTLRPDHLHPALQFANSAEPRQFDALIDAIVQLAWDHIDEDGIALPLAQLMLERARQYEPFFLNARRRPETAPDDPARRRTLVEAMIEASDDPKSDGYHIADTRLGLVGAEDFEWLVERAAKWQGSEKEAIASEVAARAFDPTNMRHLEIAWGLDRDSALWKHHLESWFRAIEIESEQARRLRSTYERTRQTTAAEPDEDGEQTTSELRARLSELLDAIRQGAVERFWELNRLLLVDPNTRRYRGELEMRLTSLPGWQLLDDEDRGQVIEAAKAYVASQRSQPERWLGTTTLWRPAVAGYRALVLLLDFGHLDYLQDLPPEVWAEWAPVIVSAPEPETVIVGGEGLDENSRKLELLEHAYSRAPGHVLEAFRTLLDAAAGDPEQYFSHETSLEHIFDERVGALLEELLERDVPSRLRRQLLDVLMKKAPDRGIGLVRDWLGRRDESEEIRQRALDAAGSALRFQLGETWAHVWAAMAADAGFGVDLILSTAERFERPPISVDTLGEAALADLAGWMFENFPPEQDPDIQAAHFVGPREQVAHWRGAIVTELVNAGTAEAANAVHTLATKFPQYLWLRNQALEAEEAALRASWTPIKPEEASRLVAESGVRIVQNADQLQRVVVEALDRLGTRLQGALPEAVFLWDERERRPKPEERLSDYVTRFLRDDLAARGVVANREVEIQNWRGRGIGERTDILVEAAGPGVPARLVIEVKGCWNAELYKGMAAQLWDRYMHEWGTRNGIYLVSLVDHRDWNDAERREYGCLHDRETLSSAIREQATGLITSGAAIEVVLLDCSLGDIT